MEHDAKKTSIGFIEILLTMIIASIVLFVGIAIFAPMNDGIPSEQKCNELNNKTWEMQRGDGGYSVIDTPNESWWCIRNETGWHLNTSRTWALESSDIAGYVT